MSWKTISLEEAKKHKLWNKECHIDDVPAVLMLLNFIELFFNTYYFESQSSVTGLVLLVGLHVGSFYVLYKFLDIKDKSIVTNLSLYFWIKFGLFIGFLIYIGAADMIRLVALDMGIAFLLMNITLVMYTHYNEIYRLQYRLEIKK